MGEQHVQGQGIGGSPTCDTKRTTHIDNADKLHLRDNYVNIKIIIIIKVKERSQVLFSFQ